MPLTSRPRRAAARALVLLSAAAACDEATIEPTTPGISPDQAGLVPPTCCRVDTTRVDPAVAGIRFVARQFTLPLGARSWLAVVPVNAAGYPSLALLARAPRIRSANPAVLAVDDSGTVRAVGLGTTKVYATLDAWSDSATVTVVTRGDSVPRGPETPPPAPPPPPPPVARFNLTAAVVGPVASTAPGDTLGRAPVAGATVRVYQIVPNTAGGRDSLVVGPLVATGTADASGIVTFRDVASGSYSVQASGPAGAGWADGRVDFGPPRQSDVRVVVTLRRR